MSCPRYLTSLVSKLHKLLKEGLFFRKSDVHTERKRVKTPSKVPCFKKIDLGTTTKTSSGSKFIHASKKRLFISFSLIGIYRDIQGHIKTLYDTLRHTLKNLPHLLSRFGITSYYYIKYGRFRELTPAFAVRLVRRHFPLFLAILFTTPVAILLGIFIYSKLNRPPTYAAPFTGAVRVSKQSTTLSSSDGWLEAMAYSGDGVNGDGDYFQPIHPGTRSTVEGAPGTLAVGEVLMMAPTANNYDAAGAQFIPWQPNANGNFYGIILGLVNTASTVNNLNVVVEVLRFPTAVYSGGWTNYVSCTALNTCVYPADTVIERAQVMRFDQSISGETVYPGQYGLHYMDFRFDPPLAVDTSSHYGFRVYYNSLTTAAGWPRGKSTSPYKPTVNAINFGLGIANVDTADSSTVSIPLANTNNMVAINSAPAVGQADVARTQNENWSGTYSSAAGNWTITGSVSGAQTAKLTTATTGGTGASWVNDGVVMTTLSTDATVSTRLCVNSITGFAAGQYIDIWDSQTASIQKTIASVNASDSNCDSLLITDGPSIIVTASLAAADKFTVAKNATVAQATWKLRIIQGAEEAITQILSTTKFCVGDAAAFSVPGATYNNVNLWDDNSPVGANRITVVGIDDAACTTNPGDDSITVATTIAAFTLDQHPHIAEFSTNFSNYDTPDNGDIFRFTSLNMGQNPAKVGNGNYFSLLYGKTAAPATSAVNYPYLSFLRHPFYIAYGDADTSAPVDGDMVIVGGGAADPDSSDSPNLANDLILGNISGHTVTVDKNFEMPMVYTGATGGGVGNGLTTPATASYGGSGFVSALITTRAKLAVSDAADQRYRLTVPGRILLSSGASLELGSSTDPLPETSSVDLYLDSVGPTVSSNLTSNSGTVTYIDVASTDGFYIGDVVMIKDNNSVPVTRIIAAINSSTRMTFTTAMVAGYDTTQSATVSRGAETDIPTGADRRSHIYSARAQAARVNMYSQGSDSYRTPQADLAVDIDGNIDTGYLGAQQTTAGNTWLDASGTLAGDWSALDPISVAQGNSYAVNNWDSSLRMGANDDANVFPTWTGVSTLGLNAEPAYNTEITEIGTIPLTNIYNSDYNSGSSLYSSNYATNASWTIFGDNANTEIDDAVYFGDQGDTPIYALEFNIGTAINADATRVWEYWNGSSWTQFTPSQAWENIARGTNNYGIGEYCIPFNANPTFPTNIVQLTDTGYFIAGQYAKIKDNDSPTIIRRISAVAAGAPANVTFTEVIPEGYATAQSAKVCIPNGGQWTPMAPSDLFTQTGRTLISWNSWDTPTPAKTTINGINAYWVRNRISAFTSWTTSPTNQTTPVSMQGVETVNSYPFAVFNAVNEARFNHLSKGTSFDPNETFVLRYNDNSTAISTLKTTRWYESQITSWGTAHRWRSPNDVGNTTAYYEKNTAEANWRTLNGGFDWTDYNVTSKIYFASAKASNIRIGHFLRQNADNYGYALYISPAAASTVMQFYTIADGAETAITGSYTIPTFNIKTWYCLKTQVTTSGSDNLLKAKLWMPASPTAACSDNEPVGWIGDKLEVTHTPAAAVAYQYSAGRFGLAADTALARFDDVKVKNSAETETWFTDSFNDTGCWRVYGSKNGTVTDYGCAYNSVPFTSSKINFTIKHKGGVQSGETGANAVVGPLNAPEQGDEIYISPLMRGSNIGLDETTGIATSNTATKYENWDFVYNPSAGNYTVTGSQYGAAGSATPGSTYTSPDGEISLKIKSGTPSGPKFGSRAAYFQNSVQRATGNFTGLNNHSSAIIFQPTWVVLGSATGYNIEGAGGAPDQKGTIDFWFKPNFSGPPDYLQYLFDYANQGNTDRLSVRINSNGKLEFVVWSGTAMGATVAQSFSPVAGQWYHFRGAWEDTGTVKAYAWLDGDTFETNQGLTIAARGANAGFIRLGNSWQYNAGFDGAIDEFAIFDDAVDTSVEDNWGDFTPPTSEWTAGQTAGTANNTGVNIFLAHFNDALEPQKGTMFADYFIGHPVLVFTNGADTLTNDRIRVITQPKRTRLWVDNTGSQYTPSARVKYSEGYAATVDSLGWMQGFQYHHRAASSNSNQPITSPVLNLRKQIRLWSDEDVGTANDTASINQGYGVLLYYPKEIDINHTEFQQTYFGVYTINNPYSSVKPYPTQYIRKSAFNQVGTGGGTSYAVCTSTKILGSQVIDNNNFAILGHDTYPIYETASANLTYSNNYIMSSALSVGFNSIYLSGGRVFTISGNKFINASYYPVTLTTGTAKVTLSDNEFWRFRHGLTLNGNSFVIMSGNTFDGGVSSEAGTTGLYGTGVYVAPGTTNVEISDNGSSFGRSIWNEADISMPADASSYLAGSLLRYTAENTSLNSNFHYLGLSSQGKLGNEYIQTAIPGVDIRMGEGKDISNYTNFGDMRTTGAGLIDTTVRTSGGYGWRLESTSKTDALEYTAKVVGVSGKPLAITGYLRINDDYGVANLPTVTLSGLGMTGPNLTWTAAATADTWQQFVVSGTPTESALATLTITVQSEPVLADSGTAENVDDGQGINLPTIIEDADKSWIWNQWAGYKMLDDQGFVFDIIGNTATRLFLKGTRIPFSNILPTQPYGAAYEIFSPPYVYLDDVSVLSGTVDTGTLDFHSAGQPVSPWLSTGLTAEGVWGAQYSTFADIEGTFGQLMQDALIARYADVSDPAATTTTFNTNLSTATDDFYNDGVIIFTEGQNKGVVRRIADYGGASKTIIVDPALPFAPADGDRFAILAATSASTGSGGATAAEIWSYTLRQLTTEDLEGGGSLATAADIASIQADIADVLTELGTGNISAIKTATDTINWSNVTGLVTTAGEIKAKTDDIDWADIETIQTNTGDIDWADITAIKLKTDSIVWGDITNIRDNVATLFTEIGTGNISAIKTATDTIDWDDITGIITTAGLIQDKTDTINWSDVTGIKTATDTIDWNDVTGIKAKTDTIAWGDIATLQSSVNALNDISAADIWAYADKTITGVTTAGAQDIWDTACAILNTSGSVGKQVCDNLDAAVSSRSTLTAAQVWAETTRTITGLENPALAAIAANVWSNATRELTYYGNDITAQDVWDVLTSSLTTIDSIGKLLVANVDETISSRSSQSSLDTLSENVATTSALVDVSVSSRASQESLDAHESAQAAFRSSTTNTLGTMTVNVAAILTQLSSIETKIDTITSTLSTIEGKIDIVDANLDSVKTTVEDTNIKVTAMQTVTNDILAKWGSYDATTIIGYIDTLETNLGDPDDATSSATVFGKLNYIKENSGSGGTVDLIYAQAQSTHTKLLEVQTELGFNGKSTTAYDEMIAIKGYVDTAEASLATLDTRTSSIATSVTNVSNDLKTVTDRIGKVSVDSFTQLFEVKSADIDYLKNKIIELKAMADINRQLLEKTANQPIVKVIMEWGSVIIKFVIVNPSDSTTQKIPFKAFLPKEVKQEYIMDLGGLTLNYDATTEQYYVTADITLEKGESVTRSVEIKDIWTISDDEVASLRKQADELSAGLKNTSYFAQGLTLKTDINTRLDKVVRKQKDNNATPQDHILAYRENIEDMKAVNDNIKGLKDLVLNSGAGSNFLASIGGIQTFATWGIVLALIFGMGALGVFYYQLWRRKVVTVSAEDGKKKTVELPTPIPFVLPGFNFPWLKKILFGWTVLLKDVFGVPVRLVRLVIPHGKKVVEKVSSIPKKTLVIFLIAGVTASTIAGGVMVMRDALKKSQTQVMGTAVTAPTPTPLSGKEEKVKALVGEMVKEAAEKKNTNERIEELMKKTEEEVNQSASPTPTPTPTPEETQAMIQVKDPTDTINVREKPDKTAPVLTKIKAGKDYLFLAEEGDWYQIDISDSKKGWVNKDFVKKVETKETTKAEEKSKVLGAVSEHQQLLVIKQTPTDWLNVRKTPSLLGEIITKVYPGESYPFSEVQSGWYKILLKDLTEGWVSAQYVEPEKEMTGKASDFVEVISPEGSGVNIREKPDKESRVIKTVYINNKYPKLGEENGWVKIETLDGKVGFVSKEFTQASQ